MSIRAADYTFYRRALQYVRREYPDDFAWFKEVGPNTFLRMRTSTFLSQYIWVVYVAGFRVAVLQDKWPALCEAFANCDLHRLAQMRSARAALRIIAHERKATCVLRGARIIAAEGFARFKKRLLTEGVNALAALPGIGPITKDHLARNIGLASVAKDDIWIQRVRKEFGVSDKDAFVARLASRFRQSPGLVDFVIWQYCADAAWRDDGFGSLRAVVVASLPNMPFDPSITLPRLRLGRALAGQRRRWADQRRAPRP
jgi:hypothetical protein